MPDNLLYIGNIVVYRGNGVCKIDCITHMETKGQKQAYFLHPLRKMASSIYVPCNNAGLLSSIRAVMTREQMDDLLGRCEAHALSFPDHYKQRGELLHHILAEGVGERLVLMFRWLHGYQQVLEHRRKPMPMQDQTVFNTCAELLKEECAMALGCTPEEAGTYVYQHCL